ncbi:hypothetical protein MIND_00973400 [Mycena indigotica]|uniref:Uncharacterized protein n=1 Tax=Mycena indigotica TaxID=2126181 RepID=A0A8H6SED3_9AGAR|nr:uncharacterized protein MIND_00973400 [Mycena indigotica]KAF7297398.1 hypothetical protein MIND_00973400 [Mycena indigotica]
MYLAPNRLHRVRNPIPQLNIGPGFGEVAAAQDAGYTVVTLDGGPQQVQTMAIPTATTDLAPSPTFASLAIATTTPSATPTLGETTTGSGTYQRTALYHTSTYLTSISTTASDSFSSLPSFSTSSLSATSGSSSILSSLMTSDSLSTSLSISSSSAWLSSSSSFSTTSSLSPSPILLLSSPSSPSPSSSSLPQTVTGTRNRAPFYTAIILGTLIISACVLTVVAFCIRIRNRRRSKLHPIRWDPVTPSTSENKPPFSSARDASLSGDRDVGEPRRANNTLDRRGSNSWETPANPFADSSQPVHFRDSAVYKLPPAAPHSNGPYPTARPLPAHLRATPSVSNSRINSRTGSIKSNLASPTTLCVANVAPPPKQLRSDTEFDYLGVLPAHEQRPSVGTLRETDSRPRFMSLGGRGLDVPWRNDGFKELAGEAESVPAEAEEGVAQSWRASWLNILQSVTGAGKQEEKGDNLTPAPSMVGRERRQSVNRERRESGWAKFAAAESVEMDGTAPKPDDGSLAPPPARAQASGMSYDSENSRTYLLARPGSAFLSRAHSGASSVYSTASGMPPTSTHTLSYLTNGYY